MLTTVSDIRRETIAASRLEIGMYVSDLDRPWLDTPFMLQGFLLEEHKQIDLIRDLCHTVIIDRTRSTMEHYKKNVTEEAQHEPSIVHVKIPAVHTQSTVTSPKIGFFDIFGELISKQKEQKKSEVLSGDKNSGDKNKANLSAPQKIGYYADTITQQTTATEQTYKASEKSSNSPSLSQHLKKDTKSWLRSALSLDWLSSPDKDKLSSGGSAPRYSPTEQNKATKDGNRITIYQEHIPVEQEIVNIAPVYEKTQIATRAIFEAIAAQGDIDLSGVHDSLDQMVESIERNPDALMWLSKLKQTDGYSYNHALNVSINLMALAQFMSLPKYQVKELGMAGLLQDIGKVKVDPALLSKTSPITQEERTILEGHVKESVAVLGQIKGISPPVLYTIEQHHERFDGSGYPKQLANKQISLQGQLAGLVDTYCAMTTDKPYAKGLYNQEALDEIYTLRDTKFNPMLIEQLVQFLGIYPVSSLVELNTGEVAVVVEQNFVRRLLPRVMVILGPDKTRNNYPPTIDLINAPKTPSGEVYSIIRGIPPFSYGLNPNEFYMA
jgi:HD-GYP domain-containing protein (c-di-GMP phosphodiesterase class II)